MLMNSLSLLKAELTTAKKHQNIDSKRNGMTQCQKSAETTTTTADRIRQRITVGNYKADNQVELKSLAENLTKTPIIRDATDK